MKTREKILLTSLLLFNEEGEPNVTTVDIANEMDISPGNLYYHFKGKDAIILALFEHFEAEFLDILTAPVDKALNIEDSWFYLYVVFEEVYNFRFFYQNLNDILQRNPSIGKRFKALLQRKLKTTVTIIQALIDHEIIVIDEVETTEIAHNINLVLTHWLNYAALQDWPDNQVTIIHQGVFQVMSLIAPYFSDQYQHIFLEMKNLYQQLQEQDQ